MYRAILFLLIIEYISHFKSIAIHTEIVCPYGFIKLDLMNTTCVKLKKKETYFERFNGCNKNDKLRIRNENGINRQFQSFIQKQKVDLIWLDIRRAYNRGPYLIWETQSLSPFNITENQVPNNSTLECAVLDISSFNVKPYDCNEKVHRVCVVKPLNIFKLPEKGPCKKDFVYYSSPKPTCLTKTYTDGYEGFVKGKRDEVQTFCKKLGGNLIGDGRMYRQNTKFSNQINITIPINLEHKNISSEVDLSDMESDYINESSEENDMHMSMNNFGQLNSRKNNFIYNAAICEHPIDKAQVELKLYGKENVGIVVQVLYRNTNYENRYNFSLTPSDFWCFTDAKNYYPNKVDVSVTSDPFLFKVDYKDYGYYWCHINNTVEFEYNKTERILFIKNIESLLNIYVGSLKFDDHKIWKVNYYDKLKNSSLIQYLYSKGILNDFKLKKVFSNGEIVFHVQINSSINYDWISNEEIDALKPFIHTGDISNGFMMINSHLSNDTKICYKTLKNDHNCMEFYVNRSTSLIHPKNKSSLQIATTETPVNEDRILQINSKMKNVLKGSITNNTISEIVNDLNEAISFKRNVKIPSDILQNLDTVLKRVEINSTMNQIHSASPSLVVGVIETGGLYPVCGIKLNKINVNMNDSTIDFLDTDQMNHVKEDNADTEIIVEMPNISLDSSGTLAVVVFQNENFFTPNQNQTDWNVNSRVVGVSTKNELNFSNDQYIDIHIKPYKFELQYNEEKVCVFWDFGLGDGGGWSMEGCELLKQEVVKGFDTCRCKHMTHFAEIIQPGGGGISNNHRIALTVITYFGCSISMVGLIAIAMTALLFDRWRKEFTNKIYLNLSAAITILLFTFIIGSTLGKQPKSIGTCLILGGFLHYGVLAAFCWMLITATLSYKKLVHVFSSSNQTHRLLRASLCGWLIPVIPVLLLMSINPSSYMRPEQNLQHALFCYPSGIGFWLTVFLPILLIVSINMAFYCLIVYKAFIKTSIDNHNDKNINRRKFYASFLLFFLFGLSWIFGFLSRLLIMSYLFCITATTQGFILFVFFILVNKKTRNMWYKKLHLNYFKEVKSRDTTNKYWVNKETSTINDSSRSRVTPSSDIPLIENTNQVDPKAPVLKLYSKKRLSELL